MSDDTYQPPPEASARGARRAALLEWQIPLLLLAASLTMLVCVGLAAGPHSLRVFHWIGIHLGITITVTPAVLFLWAALVRVSYGPLKSAIPQLVSITALVTAIIWLGLLLRNPWPMLGVSSAIAAALFVCFFKMSKVEIVLAGLLVAGANGLIVYLLLGGW